MTTRRPYRIRTPNRWRRCYELTWMGVMRDDAWTLVHGTIKDYVAHAWLEKGETCYDAVRDEELPKSDYYTKLRARAERRYTQKEAAQQGLQHNNYGPWHGWAEDVRS